MLMWFLQIDYDDRQFNKFNRFLKYAGTHS